MVLEKNHCLQWLTLPYRPELELLSIEGRKT